MPVGSESMRQFNAVAREAITAIASVDDSTMMLILLGVCLVIVPLLLHAMPSDEESSQGQQQSQGSTAGGIGGVAAAGVIRTPTVLKVTEQPVCEPASRVREAATRAGSCCAFALIGCMVVVATLAALYLVLAGALLDKTNAQLNADIASAMDGSVIGALRWAVFTTHARVYKPFESVAIEWMSDGDAMMRLVGGAALLMVPLAFLLMPDEEQQSTSAAAKSAPAAKAVSAEKKKD